MKTITLTLGTEHRKVPVRGLRAALTERHPDSTITIKRVRGHESCADVTADTEYEAWRIATLEIPRIVRSLLVAPQGVSK